MAEIHVPELALIALVGASGSGKSTFARERFAPYEAISSDACRALVSGDDQDQSATADAFEVLHHIAGKRLDRGLLTVIDATNTTRRARTDVIEVAKQHDVLPVAIVLDLPLQVMIERDAARGERAVGPAVIRRQKEELKRAVKGLQREGFRHITVLTTPEEVAEAVVVRDRLLNNLQYLHGPFDIIGDVHGCLPELEALLTQLGYALVRDDEGRAVDAVHPDGRTVVFVGDLVDRGPSSVGVLRLAMGMSRAGHALAVPGNHEAKLVRALDGRQVNATHGLESTLAELATQSETFRQEVRDWCYGLISHLVLDDGNLVVAHAGLKEEYHGRASGRVRSFALYGDTTGETDQYGLPVRLPWADEYRGRAMVVYGHVPTTRLKWINNTICLDTGAVFGGQLSALRYPERETVQVPSAQVYYEPTKPLTAAGREQDELRLSDVLGARGIETTEMGRIPLSAENAAGALEVMSRFALHPRLVPYLPPTMSPVASSALPDYLEHPAEAFSQFQAWGVPDVVCQEKHMGSRAVLLLHPDGDALYTRTGRAFFTADLQAEFCVRARTAAQKAGLFDQLETDWLLFDAELLPWSLKSEPLLREQYAGVGAAARLSVGAEVDVLAQAAARGLDVGDLLSRAQASAANASAYDIAWRRYAWPTQGLDGVQLAVFQILAADGQTFETRDHRWHLACADALVDADPELFRRTRRCYVTVGDEASVAEGTQWWLDLTGAGGEGMVVKPVSNLTRTGKGSLVQPGLKVRGREYLRIIYGPNYTEPDTLPRLKDRNLGKKRSLALREYALGLESLRRYATSEPLWRIHEAVFAVLALESEPVDPRL